MAVSDDTRPPHPELESTMPTRTYKPLPVKSVDLELIDVPEESYQRATKSAKARKIAENFEPALAGVLFVAGPLENGRYRCWDGGHRLSAMRALGISKWSCQVGEPSERTEAELFDRTNTDRAPIRPWEHHKARLVARNEVAETIDRITSQMGWTLLPDQPGTRISSVQALYWVVDRWSIDVLEMTLALITATWGHDPDGMTMPLIRGLATFIGKHPDVEHSELVDRMKVLAPKTYHFRAKARYTDTASGTNGGDVYRYTVDVWNERRRTKRLQAI